MTDKEHNHKLKQNKWIYGVLASIPLIGFILFGLIPLVLSAIISFTDLKTTVLSEMNFIGVKNYIKVLTNYDRKIYSAYLTTLIYMLNAPLCVGISLYIANLVNKTKFGKKLVNSILFIPYVCSSVVIGLTFKLMYKKDGGALNSILTSLGFEEVGWLSDSPLAFLASTIIMTVWSGLGFCIVLYQAALANIDKTYYEAADIDGASSFVSFWKITFPAVSSTTGYLITMKLIWAMQAMVEPYILAQGSTYVPMWSGSNAWVSDTVVMNIYNSMKTKSAIASASGWILAILVLIVTRINIKVQEKLVNYDF